jgi:uncharacterized protein YbjT (DUF2867 family)
MLGETQGGVPLSGTRGAAAPPVAALPGRVVVTGALGHLASQVVPRLAARGVHVIGVVRAGRDTSRLERAGIEVRRGDLEDPGTLQGAFEGADAIVHLSGMAQVPGFLGRVAGAGIRRGVFVGSTGIYTRLESAGAEAKRVAERELRASGLDYVILRPTMIYGTPEDRNFARLLRWLRRCPVMPVPGGGDALQQPVHVEDLARAIVTALERPALARREYDLGGPEALPLAETIRACGAALGRRVWLVPIPLGPSHGAVMLLRSLGLPSPVRGEQVLRLAESKAVDIEPARHDLDFRPRPFSTGIAAEARALEAVRNRAPAASHPNMSP